MKKRGQQCWTVRLLGLIMALLLLCEGSQAQTRFWVWGDNIWGGLGVGDTYTERIPVRAKGPGGVGLLENIVAASGGNAFSVALKSDGTVWACGYNNFGQLGNIPRDGVAHPFFFQVKGQDSLGFLTDVHTITTGWASAFALKSDGTAWTWGAYPNSETTALPYHAPIQIPGPGGVGALDNLISVTGGWFSSIGLKSDGTVWTWGLNRYGQLGDGTTTWQMYPAQVAGIGSVIAVSAGMYFNAVLTSDGTVWTWGDNQYGQLGDGTTTQRHNPIQVTGAGGTGFLTDVIAISSGGWHILALKSDGTLWAWGLNSRGQLGNGTQTNSSTPVLVVGPDGLTPLTDIVAIEGGGNFSLALKSDGTIWGWGSHGSGQLGVGWLSQDSFPLPVQIPNLTHVASIGSLSYFHSLAIEADGAIRGRINLDNLPCFLPVRFEFRPIGGGDTITCTKPLGTFGDFTFFDIPQGTYDIAVDAPHFLQKVLPGVSTVGGNNVLNLQVTLIAGDANNDNSVDVLDLDILIQNFDTSAADPFWDESADFNCDNSIDVLDLDLLIRNFDLQGDP